MQRCQDSINPRTHADVMVLSHEDEEDESKQHPYWYARVIGVFHTQIRQIIPGSRLTAPERVDFLWVRWFGRDLSTSTGWKAKRLHRLGFVPNDGTDSGAFGFLNPKDVIRAVHLIPTFAYGRTSDLLGQSIARQPAEEHEDWVYYYTNM
jgi:hypothetical protein